MKRLGTAMLALVLLVACAAGLSGCGSDESVLGIGAGADQQDEADVAMGKANDALVTWSEADAEMFTLLDEIGANDLATTEQITAVLALVDQVEASLDVSTQALEEANAELESILEMNVDSEYKTYVEMLIASNDTDLASDAIGREMVTVMRELYNELLKDAPSEDIVNSLSDQLETLGGEMDVLDEESIQQSQDAETYFDEHGFVDTTAE